MIFPKKLGPYDGPERERTIIKLMESGTCQLEFKTRCGRRRRMRCVSFDQRIIFLLRLQPTLATHIFSHFVSFHLIAFFCVMGFTSMMMYCVSRTHLEKAFRFFLFFFGCLLRKKCIFMSFMSNHQIAQHIKRTRHRYMAIPCQKVIEKKVFFFLCFTTKVNNSIFHH